MSPVPKRYWLECHLLRQRERYSDTHTYIWWKERCMHVFMCKPIQALTNGSELRQRCTCTCASCCTFLPPAWKCSQYYLPTTFAILLLSLKTATTFSSYKTQGLLALSGCWDFVIAPTRAVSAWVILGAWQPMSPWFHKTLFYDANTSWPPEHSIYQMCNVCRNNPNKEGGK